MGITDKISSEVVLMEHDKPNTADDFMSRLLEVSAADEHCPLEANAGKKVKMDPFFFSFLFLPID